jgi:hypothetical protein
LNIAFHRIAPLVELIWMGMKHSKKSAFKPASSYGQPSLTICMARVEEQRRLLQLVKSAVAPEIAAQIVHTLVSGSRLLVYTHSANWASQIRFNDRVILNKLQSSGQQKIIKLQVKLLMPDSISDSKRHPRLPSAHTVDSVFGNISTHDEDPLAQAMTRLRLLLKKKLDEPLTLESEVNH